MATDLRKLNEKKDETKPVSAVAEGTSTVPANNQIQPQANKALGAANNSGTIEGEVDSSDYQKPYLGLAQGVGFGVEYGWRPGDFVLGKEFGLYRPASNFDKGTDPIRAIVIRASKKFIERLPQDSAETPRIFDHLEDAKAAGLREYWGTSGDKTKDRPTVEPVLRTGLLIAKSKAFNQKGDPIDCPSFYLDLGDAGEQYAAALWSIGGTAYKAAASPIITYAKGRKSYGFEIWLSSRAEKTEKTLYYVPVVKRGPDLSAKLVSEIEAQLSSI
jgi:hypothetical protein